jgi:hypothetical protein
MVAAGHLQPLLYIYGGLGGTAPAYYYWGNSAELAKSLATAWPYLPEQLRESAATHLQHEWEVYPPLKNHISKYREGTPRAPYRIPYDLIGRELRAVNSREAAVLQWRSFGDLYGISAYHRLTNAPVDSALRRNIRQLVDPLLKGQDWALMGPIYRSETGGFFQSVNFFNRNGQATANVRLAGAIGMTRLADSQKWKEESSLGRYLTAKYAVARVGMARYTSELHAMGIARGEPVDDWRTLVHIDRRCAIPLRGHLCAVFRADQEIPPFIGLVEEVGRLLGRYAQDECGYYLNNLDESMPLWFISEAPKQSASEQRLSPLHHKSGNVLAQYWVLGKSGEAFRRYVDTTRFRGDYYYIHNLSALIESYSAMR